MKISEQKVTNILDPTFEVHYLLININIQQYIAPCCENLFRFHYQTHFLIILFIHTYLSAPLLTKMCMIPVSDLFGPAGAVASPLVRQKLREHIIMKNQPTHHDRVTPNHSSPSPGYR